MHILWWISLTMPIYPIRKHTARRRTPRIDTNTSPRCVQRPNPTEWPWRDGVRQLCAMQLSSKKGQLSKHRGEACGFSCITSSSSSWLEHRCHISEEFKSDVVVQFKQAKQKTRLPTVTVKGCGKPLAARGVIWFEAHQYHCGCRWLWFEISPF